MIEREDPVNFSTLKHILKSPRHYRHALAHPREDTDALRLGRAIHAAIYEPERFASEWVVSPNFHRGMKDDTARAKGYDGGKSAALEWEAQHQAVEIVSADQMEAVKGMRAALILDPVASRYIVGGVSEQPIAWLDDETGICCRGRVDHCNGAASDLKSTAFIEPRAVSRSVGSLLMHMQLAYYTDGLTTSGYKLHDPGALIFVESCAPHDVLVLEFTDDDIAKGRAMYRKALSILKECRERNEWPGVAGGEKGRVQIPEWAVPEQKPLMLDGEPW